MYIWGPRLISATFQHLDLVRPLEGRLGHQFRVRVSFAYLWGGGRVKLRFSIFAVHPGAIVYRKVRIFGGPRGPHIYIYTYLTCLTLYRPLEGRLGHQFRVRCGKGCHFGVRRVKLRFWTFLAPFWGHCAKTSNSKKWSFLLIFAGFDCFSKKNSE